MTSWRVFIISGFIIAFMFSIMVANEINAQFLTDEGYPLFYYSDMGYINFTGKYDLLFNDTIDKYDFNKAPANTKSDYLDSGMWTLTSSYGIVDYVIFGTVGFGFYVKDNLFTSIPYNLVYAITVFQIIINLVFIASFLRGLNII